MNHISTEARGRQLYEKGQYWIEGDTAHVEDDDHVFVVPILDTGPACYCNEFAQWHMCAHTECILHATGEPGDDDWYQEMQSGYMRDIGAGNFR